jgi:hypothetical protein
MISEFTEILTFPYIKAVAPANHFGVILKSIEEFNLIVGKFQASALHRLYNYWKFRWFQSHIVWKLAFKSPENSLFSYHHKRLEKSSVGIIFVWPIFTIIITLNNALFLHLYRNHEYITHVIHYFPFKPAKKHHTVGFISKVGDNKFSFAKFI